MIQPQQPSQRFQLHCCQTLTLYHIKISTHTHTHILSHISTMVGISYFFIILPMGLVFSVTILYLKNFTVHIHAPQRFQKLTRWIFFADRVIYFCQYTCQNRFLKKKGNPFLINWKISSPVISLSLSHTHTHIYILAEVPSIAGNQKCL